MKIKMKYRVTDALPPVQKVRVSDYDPNDDSPEVKKAREAWLAAFRSDKRGSAEEKKLSKELDRLIKEQDKKRGTQGPQTDYELAKAILANKPVPSTTRPAFIQQVKAGKFGKTDKDLKKNLPY